MLPDTRMCSHPSPRSAFPFFVGSPENRYRDIEFSQLMEQDDPVVVLSVAPVVSGMSRSCRDVFSAQHVSLYCVHDRRGCKRSEPLEISVSPLPIRLKRYLEWIKGDA